MKKPKFLTVSQDSEYSAITWNPWLGVLFVVVVFYASQILAAICIMIYPSLQHWSSGEASDWLTNSVYAQFIYILLAETIAIGAIWRFIKLFHSNMAAIGFIKPRWRDIGYGLLAVPVYYVIYLLTVGVVSHYVSGFNPEQSQEIGFENVSGALPLIVTFISLVIIPPLAEEIIARGFLYSSLKKAMRLVPAALLTSLIFAAAHLPEGGNAGPLYIAALDTFVLSLVLIYLREKTGSLWASITLHAFKNGVAFLALFVFHLS